jgi:hypothetical protein
MTVVNTLLLVDVQMLLNYHSQHIVIWHPRLAKFCLIWVSLLKSKVLHNLTKLSGTMVTLEMYLGSVQPKSQLRDNPPL